MGAWASLLANLSPQNWWRLNETSGTFANSAGGSTLPAPQTNGVTRGVTSLITGETNAALQATGSNGSPTDHYLINMGAGKISELIGSGSWTLMLVLKLDTTGAQGSGKLSHVFTMRRLNGTGGATRSDGFWVYMNQSGAAVPYEVNATRQINGVSKGLATGAGLAWSTSVAKVAIFTYDASDGKIRAYMAGGLSDASATGDTTAMPNITEASQVLGGAFYDLTGASVNSNYGVGGVFDDLASWNRLLNADERAAIFSTFAGTVKQQDVAVPVRGTVTATQGIAVTVADTSLVTKAISGKITDDDFATGVSRIASENSFVYVVSSVSGKARLTSYVADYLQAYRQSRMPNSVSLDGSGLSGAAKLRLPADFVICCDVENASANTASASVGVFEDASNGYLLKIAGTDAGSSSLRSIEGGTETQQSTGAEGVGNGSNKRFRFQRITNTFSAYVDDTSIGSFTDASPTSVRSLYFGVQPSSGTADVRLDNLTICSGTDIIVRGVPTGGSVRLYDAAGSTIASATETGGVATLSPAASVMFPITGYIQVFTDSYTTPATRGRFPGAAASGTSTAQFLGGDTYHYNLTTHQVIGTEFASAYGTTQVDSHNGCITHDGHLFGVAIGWEGTIKAWRAVEGSPVAAATYEIEPQATLWDQHQPCSCQVDSQGYLHVVYGGYHYGQSLYHRKSLQPWSIDGWSSRHTVADGLDAALLIDDQDNLYAIGSQANATGINQLAKVYKSTDGGSSWSGTTLATAATDWYIYVGDATIGKESSGAKSLYVSFWSYSQKAISSASGTTVSGSKTVTFASTSGMLAGASITHANLPAGTYVRSVDSGTQITVTRSATASGAATASFGAIYKDAIILRSTDRGATWKGVKSNTALTLPMTQDASTGLLSDLNAYAYYNRVGYSQRIGVSNDNTKLFVMYYEQGYDTAYSPMHTYTVTLGSSATTPAPLATGAQTQGTIDEVGDNVVYVDTNVSTNDVLRYLSSDDGVTWRKDTMVDAKPDGYPPAAYWPKITPVAGQTYVKVLWQERDTIYAHPYTGTLTGEGVSALNVASLLAVVATTQSLAVSVITQGTQTQGIAVVVRTLATNNVAQGIAIPVHANITAAQPLAVAVKTINTATQDLAIVTSATTFSTSRTVGLGVRVKVAGLQKTQSFAVRVTDASAPKARIVRETYVDSDQFGSKTVESDTFGERTTYIHPESTIS